MGVLVTVLKAAQHGSFEEIQPFVAHGVLPVLADLIARDEVALVLLALKAIKEILAAELAHTPDSETWPWRDILEECGGVDRLHALFGHHVHAVFRCSVSHGASLALPSHSEPVRAGTTGCSVAGVSLAPSRSDTSTLCADVPPAAGQHFAPALLAAAAALPRLHVCQRR